MSDLAADGPPSDPASPAAPGSTPSTPAHPVRRTPGDAGDAGASRVPPVRRVGLDAPLRWLARGAADLVDTRGRGVFYGLVFAWMGTAILLVYQTRWQLTMGLTAGFFLVGPFLCCGLYWLSRARTRGEPASLRASLTCWSRNPKSIGFFAAMLTFLMVIWARVSVVLFALFSTAELPTLQHVLAQVFSLQNLEFLAVWAGAGFVFASIAFAISVVSVPLMLDRDIDTMMAVFASVKALWANPLPMYLWAALIVLLVGASLVLWFGLLVITVPLVGHATWHAYRDLVGDEANGGGPER